MSERTPDHIPACVWHRREICLPITHHERARTVPCESHHANTHAHMHSYTEFFNIFCCCSCCCCSRCLQIDCDESLSNINIGYTRQTARCWHRMQILFATSHGMCAMQCSTYWPLHAHTVPSPSTQQNTSRIAGIWVYMQLKNHVRTLCKCIYIFFSVAVVFIFDRKSRCKCAASSWLGEG